MNFQNVSSDEYRTIKYDLENIYEVYKATSQFIIQTSSDINNLQRTMDNLKINNI